MARELYRNRELVVTFAERDIASKYKQMVFGIGWAVIQPLITFVTFVIFFGSVIGLNSHDRYAAFVLSALIPWQFLSGVINQSGRSLIADGHILRKVYFPRLVPVLGKVGVAAVQFGIGLVLLLIMAPLCGAVFSINWLWLPVLGLGILLLALSVAIPLSVLTVWYRDIGILVGFGLQIWMYASPVVYPLTKIPESWRGIYLLLNPAAGLLDGFRRVYAEGSPPDAGIVLTSVLTSLVLLVAGLVVFRKLEATVVDVI